MIKKTNGVGDDEEGHIDTKTRSLQCRLRSILFNLDLKLEKLGDSTKNDAYYKKHKVLYNYYIY